MVTQIFDYGFYGRVIQEKRKDIGIKTVDDLSDYILEKTGAYISRGTLARIEAGRQEPKVGQFMAINRALYGSETPAELRKPYRIVH